MTHCRRGQRTDLHVTVSLLQGFQAVREAVNISVKLFLLLPQKLLVKVDQLQETLRCCVVVPALVLQESLRHLIGINKKACSGKGRVEVGVNSISCMTVLQSNDRKPSHPYKAVTEHVGFSPTRQTLLASSAKCREVSGDSH